MVENPLWSQKYRPATIDECILPDRLKSTFQTFVDKKEVPNLLLSGTQGCGKTTVAYAMLKEIDADYMVINGSNEGRLIDTLRTTISQYATTVSFSGGRKYIVLDEADYLNCFSGEQNIIIYNSNQTFEKKRLDELEGTEFKIPSYNFKTNEIEITSGHCVLTGEKEVFEVTFEDGSKVLCTKDHPFFNNVGNETTIENNSELFSLNL